MRQILFVKYNRTRAAQFQLKTEIMREDEVLTVEKTALTEAGEAHIRSFGEKYEKIRDLNPAIRFLKPEWKKDKKTVSFQYLNGKTVGDALGEAIVMGEVPYQELETVMKVLFPENADAKIFEATPEFETVFGKVPMIDDKAAAVSNVDGLFENLMVPENENCIYGIDYEWVFDFPIPEKFLKYRDLLYFYRRYERVLNVKEEDLYAHFGITGGELQIFDGMEKAFQSYVHDAGSFGYMKQYEQPTKTVEFLLDRESELYKVKDWCENLKQEISEKDITIMKQQEVQRFTNNHVTNLDAIIASLRSENARMAGDLQYLSKHEAIMWKVLRKCHRAVDKVMPKGTRKRKIAGYFKNTVFHP